MGQEKKVKKAWSQNAYKTEVVCGPPVRATFSHQDTFELDVLEALQAKKMGQLPWLISSITVSAKTEVNIVCKHHLWWRHLSLAAGCITYRTQNNQGAEQEPTQVLADSPFTSMPIESINSFIEDA